MITIYGKCGISATVIADSINSQGNRLTTFELVYPRFIHSEIMTHRMLSKNAASSRAIPIKKMIELIRETPALPVFWGKNQTGMQSNEELSEEEFIKVSTIWHKAKDVTLEYVSLLDDLKLHKQISNRLSEPFQMMKTVISGTEWANLLWLRNHDAAQPEFHELAECVQKAFDLSNAQFLCSGQWHLPYVNSTLSGTNQTFENDMTLEEAQKVSASCCAQVSYRKLDDTLEKAVDIYNKLVGMDRQHASPFEHIGTPIGKLDSFSIMPNGITHRDVKGKYWSANFKGWIQYRQTLPNHVVW